MADWAEFAVSGVSEDTPKNIMLRGFRRKNFNPDSEEAKGKREKYRRAYAFMYGKDPY